MTLRPAIAAVVLLFGLQAMPAAAAPKIAPKGHWEPSCPFQGERPDVTDAEREALWRARSQAEPICLFAGAMAWAGRDKDRAAQLFALAMVRRRYDAGRCVAPPWGPMSSMMASIRMGAAEKLRTAGVQVGLEQIRPVALDPASYHYPSDHLATICEGPVKPAPQWPAEQAKMQAEIAAAGR